MRTPTLKQALAVAFLLAAWAVVPVAGGEYVFMVDTSGSMMGRPSGSGAVVVFPKVQAELIGFLRGLVVGDTLDIITFDEGIQSRRSFELNSESVRRQAIDYVQSLEANGNNTWVYDSILRTARATIEHRQTAPAPDETRVFYVFTDGRDNHPDHLAMAEMLKRYVNIRRENDYLFYITLGVDLAPDEKRAFDDHDRAVLIENEEGQLFRQGLVEIRAKVLDFGFFEGENSPTRSLAPTVKNAEEESVRIEVIARFEDVEKAGSVIEVVPAVVGLADGAKIRLRVINRDSLLEGRFAGRLQFSSQVENVRVVPDSIPVRFSTLEGPHATLVLAEDDRTQIDFGSLISGEQVEEQSAEITFNFSRTALEENSEFRVWVSPDSSGPAPMLIWEGKEVASGQVLKVEKRRAKLVATWQGTSLQPGLYRGQIRLLGDNLAFQGNALVEPASGQGSAVGYLLQVEPPPPPKWQRRLVVVLVLLGGLVLLALLAWAIMRKPPWEIVRTAMLQLGLSKARLRGKLVQDLPGEHRPEFVLKGNRPVMVGAGGDVWTELPDQIEFRARIHEGAETVVASRKQGDVLYRPRGELNQKPLSGQSLSHQDVLVLSDGAEIVFLLFKR